MATRVDKTPGLSNLGETTLLRGLRSKAGKRERDTRFIGLQRANALSDVEDSGTSLNNILRKLSLLDAAERNLYGRPFAAQDWQVTGDFIEEEIDKDFLLPLRNASIGGGSLGSQVSTTPRIRIQDRVNLINSFYGEGSFPGLHSGPDAQFYRGSLPEEIGFVKFSFNETNSQVTVIELKELDKETNLTANAILGQENTVVLDLVSYEPQAGNIIDLGGTGVSLNLVSPSTWTVFDDQSVESLSAIRTAVGQSVFGTMFFKIVRPYSVLNLPKWYTENPGTSSESVPQSADDNDPETTSKVLRNVNGQILPFTERGYWFSREYVETRWTERERDLIGPGATVVEDSNMRWFNPPPPLRGEVYNWGVRWDGYLRITPGVYGFEIQTNVNIRIDAKIVSGSAWTTVFDTRTAAKESETMYVSSSTFGTGSVESQYKNFTGTGVDDWIAYVPVTIRMFHGGPDKADLERIVPNEPDLFVKTTSVTSPLNFYKREYTITLSGTDGSWSVASGDLGDIISILQDSDASVTYSLIAQDDQVFVTPVPIALATDGTTVSSDTTGLSALSYTLSISPNRTSQFNNNLTALWKGSISSPSVNHRTYADMVDESFTPDLQKVPFDLRPDWWRISEGHPFDLSLPPSKDNTPLDGFLKNSFKPVLESEVEGIGLYGNGSGTFSSKPNIILGEVRYGAGDDLGSNYVGVRVSANRLGEGGKFIVNALPVNNAMFSGEPTRLGGNDLGGSPNDQTASATNLNPRTIRLYLTSGKYYTVVDPSSPSVSDDPETYGLPPFSDPGWLSPITVVAVRLADDSGYTTNVRNFVAPLTLSVEKITVSGFDLLEFSTTLSSILTGGSEASLFSSKYIQFYTEDDLAFQYANVDTGEGVSFADVLKLTYAGSVFNPLESEIPKPPSDRVTPFGFDDPEYSNDLCYPPYAIGNSLLESIAVDDTALYASPVGNYDVFWGDSTKSGLDGKFLEITEKLELSGLSAVETVSGKTPSADSYTHRMKIEMSLPDIYDEDVLEYLGNGEKVKDSYFTYVKLDS